MAARNKLDEFANMRGLGKNERLGWSVAADFAEWYATQTHSDLPNYSVSLVYTLNKANGIDIALRVLAVRANSSQEALGMAIETFDEEMHEYNLSLKAVIQINN